MANNNKVENNNPLYRCLPESEHKHPWLMMTHGKRFQRQTFYSISKDRYLVKLIPELQNKQVSQASYGWLLLIDNDAQDCCLINPKNMEKISLPQVVQRGDYICVLSKPPTEPNCHILLLTEGSILFCRVGEDKFIQRPTRIDGELMLSATNFQGKIYAWMSLKRGLVTVDFENENLVLKNLVKKDGQQCRIPCNRLSPSDAPYFLDYLIESCGELLLVHLICCSTHWDQVAGFRVFKIDMVEMECEELDNLGDRAIFLSKYGSMATLCSSKETEVEKDSIYYFNRELDDKVLYVYHMQYETEEALIPCPLVKSGARSLKSWVMI